MTDQPFAEGGYGPAVRLNETDRALRLLRRATSDPHAFTNRENFTDGDPDELHVWQAKSALVALMREPDLLVDLAIEAGGLEEVGYVSREGDPDGPSHWIYFDAAPDDGDELVYRRTSTEESHE